MYAQGNSGWAWFGTASGKLVLALLIAAVLAALYTCLPWRFTGSQAKAVSQATEIMGDVATAAEPEREQPSREKRGGFSFGAREPGIYADGVRLEPADVDDENVFRYDGIAVRGGEPAECRSGEVEVVFKTDHLADAFDPAASIPGTFGIGDPVMRFFVMTTPEKRGQIFGEHGAEDHMKYLQGEFLKPARKVDCSGKTARVDFPGGTGVIVFTDPENDDIYYMIEIK